VGSLPGDKDESGVAKLPDERLTEAKEKETQTGGFASAKGQIPFTERVGDREGSEASKAGVNRFPESKHEASVAKTSDERAQDIHNEMPAQEGVFLPTGVAKLPKERVMEESGLEGPSNKHLPALATVPGTKEPIGGKTLSHETDSNEASNVAETAHTTSTADAPRQPVETIPGTKESFQSVDDRAPPPPPTNPDTHRPESGGSKHDEHSKVGFGSKLKAQAKILSGKFRNDEARVEEGKAMKQGAL